MDEPRSCCGNEKDEDVSRSDVRNFYSKAAVSAQENLCCPTQYDSKDLSHIPKEVLEISYGCGSPVDRANLREGEVMVDLGSGGGIDCFIAARHVGKTGRVYGIDMTEEMLGVARKNATLVAENLGYNNIEFRQGYLESIPVDNSSVDLVTSNCVINLSTDKDEVFREIHRILKPGGRFMISDVISNKEVPEAMQNNKELWGECISGALTLNKFLDYAGKNRFKGLQVQKDYLW
ncbi:MAG: methyltransferase domain-containing protein, partial [Nitrospinaceae bacterium]|nr:methyltransferase domain-containing protein [Nitrospinaceae bacterium]